MSDFKNTLEKKQVWYKKIGNKILILTVLSSILPIIFFAVFVGLKVRNDLLLESSNSQKVKVRVVLQGLSSLINNSLQQINFLRQEPEIQKMTPSRRSPLIENFLNSHPLFFSCYVYNASGTVVSRAFRNRKNSSHWTIGKNILQAQSTATVQTARAFQRALQTKKPVFSGQVISSLQQKLIVLLVPVFDFCNSSKVVGILSFAISLSSPAIHEIISGYPLSEEEVVAFLDEKGGLISGNGKLPKGFNGLNLPRTLNLNQKIQPIELKMNNTIYLGTLIKAPLASGFLFLAQPRSIVLGFVRRLLLNLVLVLAIALVLAISAGFVLSQTLAKKITELVEGIRQVAVGVIAYRVNIDGDDELSEAGVAFNEMASALEKHRLIDEMWSKEYKQDKS